MLRDLKRGEPPTKDDLTGLKNVLDAVDAAQLKMLEGLPGNGDALKSMLDTLEAAIKD